MPARKLTVFANRHDFWKGLLIADIFIYVVYMIMGLVVYSYQGQYSFNPAYQGIPNTAYVFQTVGNAFSVITALIAALLYGNIGIKIFYAAVLRDVFRMPPLDDTKGKWIFVVVGEFSPPPRSARSFRSNARS